MKLNLGCGQDIKSGYVNVDTCPLNDSVIKMDITNLTYEENSVDEIYARDIIEHLTLSQAKSAIKNWSFTCKSGAKIFIQTTCIDLFVQAYEKKIWDIETLNYMLFAGINWVDGNSRPEDFHKSIYSIEYLCSLLKENKFIINKIDLDSLEDLKLFPKKHNLNVGIYATKI